MMRALPITPIIRHISDENDKQTIRFYHCSKTALRMPFTFEQNQRYVNLKKSEQKQEAKPNSIQRLKDFFSKEAKEIETYFNEMVLSKNKISFEQVVYHYDFNYRVMTFFVPDNAIAPALTFNKAALENIVKSNKPVNVNHEKKTLAELANSNNPMEIVNYLAGLPRSKNSEDMDLFFKIVGANSIRQALKDFKTNRRNEITKQRTLLEYRMFEKNFRLEYDKFNGKLSVHDAKASTLISSITLPFEIYHKEGPNFVMPDKLQTILVRYCGEEAINFLQSMLDYFAMTQPIKSKNRSRRPTHNTQAFKLYDPYLHFTPPDLDNIMGGFRKSPHTPPPQEDHSSDDETNNSHYSGKKRKAESSSSSDKPPKQQKTEPNLFSKSPEPAKEKEIPEELPGNQLAMQGFS